MTLFIINMLFEATKHAYLAGHIERKLAGPVMYTLSRAWASYDSGKPPGQSSVAQGMIETCDSIWANGWWDDWCEMWGTITGAATADPFYYDDHVAHLAREYRAACEDVQEAWKKLLSPPAVGYDEFKKRMAGEYTTATTRARDARNALVYFASSGVMECGQW